MAIRIFISYRRADSTTTTGRIYDRLVPVFGKKNIFRDIDNMKVGKDFRGQINETLNTSDIVLVIIGRSWLTLSDKTGKPRLEDPADFVRLEIEAALARDYIPVIPVLVDGAAMPAADQLPVSLRELAFKHALEIRHDPDFHNDIDRLIRKIQEISPRPRWYVGLVGLAVILVLGGLLAIALNNRGNDETSTNTPETVVAQQPSDTPNSEQNATAIEESRQEQTRLAATATPEASETPSHTPTDSPKPTDTHTPSPSPEQATNTLTVGEEAQAIVAATATANEANRRATASVQAQLDQDATNTALPLTQIAEATHAAQTQEAQASARAIEVATEVAVLQSTETTWTPTPSNTPTNAPTNTATATSTLTLTPTNTMLPSPTSTNTPTIEIKFPNCPEDETYAAKITAFGLNGFSMGVTAIGLNGFDPIVVVKQAGEVVACNDNSDEATLVAVDLPSVKADPSRFTAHVDVKIPGDQGRFNYEIFIDSANKTSGEFVLIFEGAEVYGSTNIDSFIFSSTETQAKAEVPLGIYALGVNELDPQLGFTFGGVTQTCQDSASTTLCEGESENLNGFTVSLIGGSRFSLDGNDAFLFYTLGGLADDFEITVGSDNQASFGSYVLLIHSIVAYPQDE